MVKWNNLAAANRSGNTGRHAAVVLSFGLMGCAGIGCFAWFARYMKKVGRRFIKKVECKYLWQLGFYCHR